MAVAIPTFSKRKKPPKIRKPRLIVANNGVFEFNKLNPVTKVRDGPQYTYGYGLVEQIVAFWAIESGQFGKVTKLLQTYEAGLKAIGGIPFEMGKKGWFSFFNFMGMSINFPMALILGLYREHWFAIFNKLEFPLEGRSYLNNLVASRYRVCVRLLQLRVETLKRERKEANTCAK